MLNGYEIVLIFALALLLFGAKKLPELARGLGQGMREFKKASREVSDHIETSMVPESSEAEKHLPSESSNSSEVPAQTA